jgi:hydroxypyruvate reductase
VDDASTPAEALAVLRRFMRAPGDVPQTVIDFLTAEAATPDRREPFPANVHNHVIGNNQVALEAAASRARELGYRVHSLGSNNRGEARDVGSALAELCISVRERGVPIAAPACLLSGGEPVVHLAVTDRPRNGGRNQEVALAAAEYLSHVSAERIAILSGGTDGEDGPTDAAGAITDAALIATARCLGLDPHDFLAINNSYAFFQRAGGLLKTGPTHTNVMDLRIALVGTAPSTTPRAGTA